MEETLLIKKSVNCSGRMISDIGFKIFYSYARDVFSHLLSCGLSLLVLYSAMRGFSPGTPVFPSHQNQNLTFDLICE